ncbi:MAG TPA: hypothetical protein VLH79_04410 [Chthonomonadales bacterium]|nr:hypothetical protein [Chthonomonadales bacterium]
MVGIEARLRAVIGAVPYRLALAGGWIDQPFVSRRNPEPPGSMVVVNLRPCLRYMDRAGLAAGTRRIARALWDGAVPAGEPSALVRELYAAENTGKAEPSGSQDMIGLIYPGISRLDYRADHESGLFPAHIETENRPAVVAWLEGVLHLLPICARPDGYNPLGEKRLDPAWIARLGRTGRECFDAIQARDVTALGASLNACMQCWQVILPHTVHHPTLTVDLKALLSAYQAEYPGAMYSGCGGGYLIVASEQPVPGALRIRVRAAQEGAA